MHSSSSQSQSRSLECQLCKKTFSQKSSLVRHIKSCASGRPVSVRQKSCRQCSITKTKCDLDRPTCSRCTLKGASCEYLTGDQSGKPGNVVAGKASEELTNKSQSTQGFAISPTNTLMSTALGHTTSPVSLLYLEYEPSNLTTGSLYGSSDSANSSGSTAINSPDTFSDSWLTSTLPSADTTPPLTKHSMELVFRILRSWPRMMAKGFQLPPIFHHSVDLQKTLLIPLANCFTLVKMWDGQSEGANSIVQNTIIKEMETLFSQFQSYDEVNLLAALQALVIYTIILIFPSRNQNAIPSLNDSIFRSLQQAVYFTAGTGLVLQTDSDHLIPHWESWVHINSKNRAVVSLYLLHWSYSIYHRLPSFNCRELGFIPAPAAKFLWQASSREQWESLYKRWLMQWEGCEYLQGEFFNIKPGIILDSRAQMWLEDADEFGILHLSIVNADAREPEFTMKSCRG